MTVSYFEENLCKISQRTIYRQADPLRTPYQDYFKNKSLIIILITVFIKHKIFSIETILSTRTHKHTHTHT